MTLSFQDKIKPVKKDTNTNTSGLSFADKIKPVNNKSNTENTVTKIGGGSIISDISSGLSSIGNTIDNITARPDYSTKPFTTIQDAFWRELPSSIVENLPFGVGEIVKQVRNDPVTASNLTANDFIKGLPEVTKQTIKGFTIEPILTVVGSLAGGISFNIKGLGEVNNAQYRVSQRVKSGESVTSAILTEAPQAIFDSLFVFSMAHSVFGARHIEVAKSKQSVNGKITVKKPPKSFRIYENPVAVQPLTPDFIDKIAYEKNIKLKNYDPKLPTYFRLSTNKGGKIKGAIVQIKPSFFDTFINKLKGNVNEVPQIKVIPIYSQETSIKQIESTKPTLRPENVQAGSTVPVNTTTPIIPKTPVVQKNTVTNNIEQIKAQNTATNLLENGASKTETILELSNTIGVDEATNLVNTIAPTVEAKIAKQELQAQTKRDRATQTQKIEADRQKTATEANKVVAQSDKTKTMSELVNVINQLSEKVKQATTNSKEKADLKITLEEKRKELRDKRTVEKVDNSSKQSLQQVFHTTEAKFTKFSDNFLGKNTFGVNTGLGHFFATSKKDITDFLNTLKSQGKDISNFKTLTRYIDTSNFININKKVTGKDAEVLSKVFGTENGSVLKGKEAEKLVNNILNNIGDRAEFYNNAKHLKEELQKEGYTGIIDNFGNGVNEYAIFNPDNIKIKDGIDKNAINTNNKDNGKSTNKDTGNKSNGKGVSETIQVGKDKPTRTRETTKGTGEHGQPTTRPKITSKDTGDGLTTRLTNEEITKKVEAITEINTSGEVILVGKVTDKLKEQVNHYKTGGVSKSGRGILDEYYTNSEIVKAVSTLLDFPFDKSLNILEPSVGVGNFLYALPETGKHTINAFEINNTTARIAKIFHPDANISTKSFETTFIDERGNKKDFTSSYDLVLGNPPYGEHRGKYLGLGEEQGIKKYEDYFIKRGLDVLKRGGTLAMVVPSSFLRSGENNTKIGISAIGNLVNAFRLPVGVFEGTDIGTDIVIFKRRDPKKDLTDLVSIVGDNFFKKNPDNILGTTKKVKNRFGKMEDVVTGSLDDALSILDTRQAEFKAQQLLKQVKIENTEDNIAEAEDANINNKDNNTKAKIDVKKAVAKEKVEQTKGEKTIKDKVKKSAKKIKGTKEVPLNSFFENNYTEEVMNAWNDTQQDGSLLNPDKYKSIANYESGKWYIDFHYAKGDIYGKLDTLEKDLSSGNITKDMYSNQKAKLEKVLPKKETIENIILSPNHTFLKELDMETGEHTVKNIEYKDSKLQSVGNTNNSLRDAFSQWLSDIPRGAFGGSSVYEVRSYIQQRGVSGNDKFRNELERRRRRTVADSLFAKYLRELPTDKQNMIEDAYNKTYNSYYVPDYSNVPMTASVNSNMFQLKASQKAGVGRLIAEGRGLLAHEVGFGKTLSGVLTAHELISKGRAKRPLIVVPKSVAKQWIDDTIMQFIPNAKVNFLGNLGKDFVGNISSLNIEDGSMSVIAYEGFNKLGFKDETYSSLVSKFGYISSPKLDTERQRQQAQAKNDTTLGTGKKGTRADISFEDLGFDAIIFDEAHKANHIVARAKPPEGKGSEWGSGKDFSQSPSTLGIKTWLASQYIQSQTGGNTFLLSATPFTNKPIEFYSILSLIGDKQLSRMGFNDVNAFFGMFFEQEVRDEFTASGKYETVTRIRRIKNFRQFRQLLGSLVDFRFEDKTIQTPNKIEHNIEIPPNERTIEYFSRAQLIFEDKDKKARALTAIDQFSKIAFSPYQSDYSEPIAPTDYKRFIEDSPKLLTAIKMVQQNLKDNPSGSQIIYSEVGKNHFDKIKSYLVNVVGLKNSEVEIITGSQPSGSGTVKDERRAVIQDNFNKGKVKVLIGSKAIQIGMNLQENTTDMHILSLPWNFLDLNQIHGRAWRQGNMWSNVRITNYLMKDSNDIHRSQTLGNKQRLYNSAIAKNANEVDISDVNHEEEALALVSDPKKKAELQLAGELKLLQTKITQQKADLSFSTRKIEKIQSLDNAIKDDTEKLKEEKIKYEKDLKEDPENASDWWVNNYEKSIKKNEKARQEELNKLAEKGIDVSTLLEKQKIAEKEIASLEEQKKQADASLEKRVVELTKTLPPRQDFTNDFLNKLIEERRQENKTFYTKAEKAKEDTITVENVDKQIKSISGKVVKTKKINKVVVREKVTPSKKSTTRDQEMLKVLTNDKLSVAEKVDSLLGKRQEGKKFKDVGKRVAGSKKENAVIQAVIQHGDDALLKQLAKEIGVDPLIAQLDKHKILQDVTVPTRDVEEKKGTPAWVAGYKVKVFQTIGKVPKIVDKTGRYGSYEIVAKDTVDNFISEYPKLLRKFVSDLNAIKDTQTLKAFQKQYTYTFADIKDNKGEPAGISSGVLGKTMKNAIRGGGKLIKDTRNVLGRIERIELVKEVLDKGSMKVEGRFTTPDGKKLDAMYRGMDDWGNRTTVYETQAEAEAMTKKYRKDNPDAIKEINKELEDYNTNYDRFVPVKTGGTSKQISDAEAKLRNAKKSVEYYTTTTNFEGKYKEEQIKRAKAEVISLEQFIARLKGETEAITHGNFGAIKEYDVKNDRFKTTFVKASNLMKVYGFKSAQLGNYMDDQSSREHIVQTMGAMEDMSKILGVDFATLVNKQGLSIAFGARGGGKFLAHYEPTHNIINLTKKRGDGSFGHEFMHFLDWTVGKETRSGKLSGAISRRYYQRTEVGKVADLITETLRNGIDVQKDKTFTPDKNADVNDSFFKTVAQWRNEDKFSFEDALNRAKSNRQGLLQSVADVYRKEFTTQVNSNSNIYYKKSLEYGGGKDTSYWVKPHELWARAFQAYLQDKLEASGIKNNYLTRNTKDISVYPQGEERIAYNKKFDELFKAIAESYQLKDTVNISEPRFKETNTTAIPLTDGGKFLNDIKKRLKIDFDVQFVDNILVNKLNKNEYLQAFGVTLDNTIVIAKDVKNTTVPHHEIVHLTLSNMNKIDAFKGLTADEVLFAKAEELGITYNKKTRNYIEEKLAQDFETYVAKGSKPKGKIRAFFDKLLELLKKFVMLLKADRGGIIKDYYDVLLTGESVGEKMMRFDNNGLVESFITDGKLDVSKINNPTFYKKITLDFKDLHIDKFDFNFAKQDVAKGILSETKKPMLVRWGDSVGKYILLDGNHRLVQAMNAGKTRAVFDLADLRFKLREDRFFKELKAKHNKIVTELHRVEAKLNDTRVNLSKALKLRETKNDVLDGKISEFVTDFRKNLTKENILSEVGRKVAEELGYNPDEINVTLQDYLKSKEQYLHIYGKTVEQRREIANLNKEDSSLGIKRTEIVRKLKLKKARLEQMSKDIERGYKRGVKSQKQGVAIRRMRVRDLEKAVGISSAQRRRLIAGRNFETMSEQDFNNFMQDMIRTANNLTQKEALQRDILAEINFKQFSKYDNLRLALGLPTPTAMNKKQLTQYRDALSSYETGDIFLSRRQIETLPRTSFGKIATRREYLRELKKNTDITIEDLKDITLPKYFENFANGLRLSRHNKLLKYVVDSLTMVDIVSEKQYIPYEHKVESLARKARHSRSKSIKQHIKQLISPTDDLVFRYIETEDTKKEIFAKDNNMTPEEVLFGNAVIAFNRKVYDYYVEMYNLTSRFGKFKQIDYMTNIRRAFLEAMMDGGVKNGVKEMFDSQREAEMAMSIIDDTGSIVPYEKWSPFLQYREGTINPTHNVARAHLTYARTFFKKKALDSYIPELLAVLSFRNDILQKTPKGLTIDGGVEEYIKKYINDARGRRISESLIPKQGGTAEATLGAIITFTTLQALGGRPLLQIGSFVGEFVTTMTSAVLQPKKLVRGVTRTIQFKKASAIRRETRHYIKRNPIEKLFDGQTGIPRKLADLSMILFSMGRYLSHIYAIQMELTPEEWNNIQVADKRILSISQEQNKFKKGEFHAGSLLGATTTGRMFGQYLSWAFDIATTMTSSSIRLVKLAKTEGLNEARKSEYARDVANFVVMSALMVVLTYLIFGYIDRKDKKKKKLSITDIAVSDYGTDVQKTMLFYAMRDANTLISAFPSLIRYNTYQDKIQPQSLPILQKAIDLFTLLQQILTQEKYKRDGKGFGIGDKKFVKTAKKIFVPVAINELFNSEKHNTKNRLIKEAIDNNNFDATNIANVLYQDFATEEPKKKIGQIGEITKMYNIYKKYGFNDELVNIILKGDNVGKVDNKEKVNLMVKYAKNNGVQDTRKKLIEIRRNKNLCTNTRKRSGCLVSNRLWKEYVILLRKETR